MSEENEKIFCETCAGGGMVQWTGLVGYVTHDMALDACEPSYEGQPIYQEIQDICPECNGLGYIERCTCQECRRHARAGYWENSRLDRTIQVYR